MEAKLPEQPDYSVHTYDIEDGPTVPSWDGKHQVRVKRVVVTYTPSTDVVQASASGWVVTKSGERDRRYSQYEDVVHAINREYAVAWVRSTVAEMSVGKES